MTSEEQITTAVDTARVASILQHVKENNIAYLLAVLISYQIGILDKMITYGNGVCA